MIKLPKFVEPRNRDYVSYSDHLRQYNYALQRQVSEFLADHAGDNSDSNFVLATTGSDGRLEKGPQSKIEIVVIGRGDYQDASLTAIQLLDSKVNQGIFHPDLEFKTLGDLYIAGYNGDLSRAYPTRVSDARFLYGNSRLLVDAYRQLYSEILMKDAGKKILENMEFGRRKARQICETGKAFFKKHEICHFDLDCGVAFYDSEHIDSSIRGSFKFGPLRLVQYGLAVEIIKKLRDHDFDLDLLEHMPSNIVDRINFFETEEKTGLSQEELSALTDNYKFFLHQYHLAQENFRVDGNNSTPFDLKVVKSRLEDLVSIVKSRRIIK